jgi:hypothetical protein
MGKVQNRLLKTIGKVQNRLLKTIGMVQNKPFYHYQMAPEKENALRTFGCENPEDVIINLLITFYLFLCRLARFLRISSFILAAPEP